jgi:UDP-galactopyranose mutase
LFKTPPKRDAAHKTIDGHFNYRLGILPYRNLEFDFQHYYPVFIGEAARLYARYRELAEREAPDVVFAGRLGAFRYLNMDDAALAGMEAAQRILDRLAGTGELPS